MEIGVTPLFLGHLNAVVANAKFHAKDRPEWLRAIDKGADLIRSSYYLDYSSTSKIFRYQNEHGVLYSVREGHCSCPATVRHCKHRAARKLVQRTLESMQVQVKTEIDELFPD